MAHFPKVILAAAILAAVVPASAQITDYPMAKTYSSVEEALAAANSVQTTAPQTYTTDRVVMPIEQGTPIQSIEIFEQPIQVDAATSGQVYTYESPTATYSYAAPYGQANANVVARTYTVVLGDTVYDIARRHGLKASQVMNSNNLSNSAIQPGQILTIPGAPMDAQPTQTFVQQVPVQNHSVTTAVQRNVTDLPGARIYAVLPGDTLYSIAKANCASVTGISQASGIATTSTLSPGQRLTLPSGNCAQ